jgi:hypothetical protein
MPRQRLYLFDTTLRDGARLFSLPRLRGRVGEGVLIRKCVPEMPPPDALRASTSPAGGGGVGRRAAR